jgi:hypothetical protein
VRIADNLRKSTVFLGRVADNGGQSASDRRATGFFVSWQSDSGRPIQDMKPECSGIYLVTARHVAERLGARFAIRFNRKTGGSEVDLIEKAFWTCHEDETVDVAVLQCGFPDWADCIPIPGRMLTKPTIEDTRVSTAKPDDPLFNDPDLGIGDIAYVVGLFHLMTGKNVNLPVVHTGHIALLPGDERIPLRTRTGCIVEVEGYLVEAHGLTGLSGAPVFSRTSAPVTAPYRDEGPRSLGGHKVERPVPGRLHGLTVLLGLWAGSWDGEPEEILAQDKNLKHPTRVPVGMGVVVPSIKIAEILNDPGLAMARREEYERRLDRTAARPVSLESSETSGASGEEANHPGQEGRKA